jgi:hypothetical protein
MNRRYRVFRKLPNGERIVVASRNEMDQVTQLVNSLKEHWPGDYTVEDEPCASDTGHSVPKTGNECRQSEN